MRSTRTGFGWQTLVLATLVSLWLALTGLLLVSRGNPEAFLLGNLGRYSRADAFKHLNSGLPFFWFVHSSLVLTAIAAARFRRTDLLTVLLIGPVIALAFNLFYQEWSDPNWYVFVAVGTIGWLVSTIIGGVYWSLRPKVFPERRSPDRHPGAGGEGRADQVIGVPGEFSWQQVRIQTATTPRRHPVS